MRSCRDEAGFSLTELLVVLAIMGLVLGGAWALLRVVTLSTNQNNEMAWQAQEIGQPLENAERMFSQQAPPMQQAGPYVCQFRTDQDSDNLYEMHTFTATTDGRITEVFYEQLPSATAIPTSVTRVWSTNNANRAAGVPMFRYYDADGIDISGQAAPQIMQYAASVKVTIVADLDGRRYASSREVFFRNR